MQLSGLHKNNHVSHLSSTDILLFSELTLRGESVNKDGRILVVSLNRLITHAWFFGHQLVQSRREGRVSPSCLSTMGSFGRWMLWTLCLCLTALQNGEWHKCIHKDAKSRLFLCALMEFCCLFFFNLHPDDLYCKPEFGVYTQKTKDTVSKHDGRHSEGLGCLSPVFADLCLTAYS